MPKTGRPKLLDKTARIDIRLEESHKSAAIERLDDVGAADISAYLRHCVGLLASGAAKSIQALRVIQGATNGKP